VILIPVLAKLIALGEKRTIRRPVRWNLVDCRDETCDFRRPVKLVAVYRTHYTHCDEVADILKCAGLHPVFDE
jgi:hypothetical protein